MMQYGYDMKHRYGDGFRRNIRFEDADHTFVIDILIPGPSNPKNEWTTVGYERVLADRRGRASARDRGHGERLSSTTDNDLPSTGGTASYAVQAGSGAGMGTEESNKNNNNNYETWGQHR